MASADRQNEDASELHRAPVVISTVGDRIEGELIAGLLRSNGVSASVVTDDAGGFEPEWEVSGVRVLVAATDADVARAVLTEQASGALD